MNQNNQKLLGNLLKILLWSAFLGIPSIGGIILYSPLIVLLIIEPEKEEILTINSPDNQYRILFTAYPPTFSAYGSTGIKVEQINKNNQRQKILQDSIKNDGASIFPENNIHTTWIDNQTLLLRLEGEEQQPVCYQITVGTNSKHTEFTCFPMQLNSNQYD